MTRVGLSVAVLIAADPGGSFGNGRRLQGRDRVLWFWCVQDRQQHCQRTLGATPEQERVTIR